MRKLHTFLLKAFLVPIALGAHTRSTAAQAIANQESAAALRYDSHDPAPPQIRQEDIDRVKLQLISAQLGASGVEQYSALDQVEKTRMFVQAFLPFLESKKTDPYDKRTQEAERKKMKRLVWSWHLDADSLGSDPSYVNGLLDMLDDESIRSTRIVQDYLAVHPGKVEQLTAYELLTLYARASAAVLSHTGANVFLIFAAALVDSQSGLPSTQIKTENNLMNSRMMEKYLDPKSHRDSMRWVFENDRAMEGFYESHTTEAELVEGVRDQLLRWSLGLLRPETVQGWGDPAVFEWIVGNSGYFASAEDEFQRDGRSSIGIVLGPKAVKQFDAGVDPISGNAASSPADKTINQHRLYAIASIVEQISGLTPNFRTPRASPPAVTHSK